MAKKIEKSPILKLRALFNRNLDYSFFWPLKTAKEPNPATYNIKFTEYEAEVDTREKPEKAEAILDFYNSQWLRDEETQECILDGNGNKVRKPNWRPVPYMPVDELEERTVKAPIVLDDENGEKIEASPEEIIEALRQMKEPGSGEATFHMMSVKELKTACEEAGISFDAKAKKSDLVELLEKETVQ